MKDKLPEILFKKASDVPKGWGKEVQIVNHVADEGFPTGYSGKILSYTKGLNATSSMHFHSQKHETFYVLRGRFLFKYYNPYNADLNEKELVVGDVVVIPPYSPHQLICLEEHGEILEFATTDYSWDNYRIAKGDSQK